MKQDIRIQLYKFSPFLFWSTIIGVFYLLSLQNFYSFLALPLMLSIHHGCHETAHGTLIPRTWKGSKRINFFSGCIGFAIVGHNYVQMRLSHSFHHIAGRLHEDVTIDMTERNRGIVGRIYYYLQLLGWNALIQEIYGYVNIILPANYKSSDSEFLSVKPRGKLFIQCQIFVFVITLLLLYVGGIYFLICRFLFLPLWGIGQNVSHYGLPVGQGKFPEFAARTYRINPIINFFLYGAGFYHFEHHVMPKMPGLLLWHPSVSEQIRSKLGFIPPHQLGLNRYLRDAFRQFLGPFPQEDQDWLSDKIPEELTA